MNKQAVIDTNVLVAITDGHDKWHEKAMAIFDLVNTEGLQIVYFDCVLSETISVMGRRAEEQKRSDQFPALLDKLMEKIPLLIKYHSCKEFQHHTISEIHIYQFNIEFHFSPPP